MVRLNEDFPVMFMWDSHNNNNLKLYLKGKGIGEPSESNFDI